MLGKFWPKRTDFRIFFAEITNLQVLNDISPFPHTSACNSYVVQCTPCKAKISTDFNQGVPITPEIPNFFRCGAVAIAPQKNCVCGLR